MKQKINKNKIEPMENEVRVRIAPSPTGAFHIGTARTALFNFLFTKKNKGKFILRIEDTDKARSQKHFEQDIIDNLDWLGIKRDEDPILGGKYGPYRQSERTEIYKKYLKKLLKEGKAFYCFEAKKEGQERSESFTEAHFSKDRDFSLSEAKKKIKAGESYIIRFKCPKKQKIIFNDLIRNKVEFDTDVIGDFSIAKNLEEPLYNFAAVIDDYEMKISHVIRGEDHLSNTPKQILLQQSLGFTSPHYAHLPLILGPDKTKLSKRHNTVSLSDYKKDGYLSEAIVNFIALLGWNPGTNHEIFSLSELIDLFSLDKVQLAGAVFDLNKLDWINGYYIRQKPIGELLKLIKVYFKKNNTDDAYLEKVVQVSRGRLKKLINIVRETDFFFELPKYDKSLLTWKDMQEEEILESLGVSLVFFERTDDFQFKKEDLDVLFLREAEKFNEKDRGKLLWPLRVALTGVSASPSPSEVASILGKQESIKRIKFAIKKIESKN